ncbi:MAG TPA: hypothetical protein VJZ71_05890 [Phycisphaerae bacterium]|nr:hypothetical protein [Phycisphaerae bacterium]
MRLSKETNDKLEGVLWRLQEAAKDIEAKFPFKAQCLRSSADTIDLYYMARE